ncbi:MAG: helix-turn-helix transcriptional regulator [Planctomycetota bacterium]|jgi:AraC-like DNA-binding protein
MDNPLIDRETSYLDLRALARQFPGDLPVRAVGYFGAKHKWVRRCSSDRLSFSFILKGGGEYRQGRRALPVRAPGVIVQRPFVDLEHGPDGQWEELYVNYVPGLIPRFEELNLLPAERPVWYVHDPDMMRRGANAILDALLEAENFGCGDRIDRIAEGLILDCLISDIAPPSGEGEKTVRGARAHIEAHYRESINLDELALDYGMSPSDFRRKWSGLMPAPPGQYVTQLRIREACRLLAETDTKIGKIARRVGFKDPLYFSRRFRQVVGETASAYRRGRRQPADGS